MDFVFGVGASNGVGRLLLLADHSIFINMMMQLEKTGNLEFACNCLEFLRDPSGANRDRVLFLEGIKVQSDFNVPLHQVPGLPEQGLRALLATVDDRLAHLEDQNAFDRAIIGWMESRNITRDRIIKGVLILLTLALLAWGARRMWQAHGFRPDQNLPLLAEAAAGPPPGPLLEQRQEEVLKSGNLWESARHLARQTFLSAGVAAPLDPLRPPAIRVTGRLWQRWQRQRQVLRLWRLAFDPRPFRVRPQQWPGLLAQLEQLQTDLDNGLVQVERAA
jgi:hypothetical protein